MKIVITFILFSFLSTAWATPKKIEMIFLSPHKISLILEMIKKQNASQVFSLLAQAEDDEKCVPMGDGCFHPQYGYRERTHASTKPVLVKEEEVKLKTFNAVETSMINCDKGNYFDIYCGQERPQGKSAEVEIWFDISSSLKSVDFSKDENFCDRRSFVTKVMEGCKDKVQASVYNTSKKEVGDLSTICMSYGTNDEKRLLQWMKDSKARVLLIVTDIDEMSHPMRDFLSENGAKLIGDGVKAFTSTDLVNYAKEFTKQCSKN